MGLLISGQKVSGLELRKCVRVVLICRHLQVKIAAFQYWLAHDWNSKPEVGASGSDLLLCGRHMPWKGIHHELRASVQTPSNPVGDTNSFARPITSLPIEAIPWNSYQDPVSSVAGMN